MAATAVIAALALIWLLRETDCLKAHLAACTGSPRPPRRPIAGRGLRVAVLLVAPLLIAALLSPLIVQYLFFRMPPSSAEFDCDDAALLMQQRLESVGIAATPMLGNLKKSGESYIESDHVWVVAHLGSLHIPLDWGTFAFDGQHYEGYPVNEAELLVFIEQDRRSPGGEIALPASR